MHIFAKINSSAVQENASVTSFSVKILSSLSNHQRNQEKVAKMALTKVKVRVKIDHNELLFLLRTSDILVQKPIQDAIEHKMELFAKTGSGF